jgi:GTP-binding protein Era
MSHKAGFVNLIGRPNAGKSTLMNQLVGERVSVINKKAQTTRHRIVGIVNEDDYQIVYSDTPGMLEPKYGLQASMMSFVKEALKDADIMILVMDVFDKNVEFFGFERAISDMSIPLLIALNKVDAAKPELVEEATGRLKELFPSALIFPMSALEDIGIDELRTKVLELLPESPPYYDKDALTDKPMRFFVSEIIRERIMDNYQKEIPYSVQVDVEQYKEEENIVRISAVIYVARKTQKGIIIGHKGAKLKKVGTESRLIIEEFIDNKVFLELYVKVDEDWRNQDRRLKAFGYKN